MPGLYISSKYSNLPRLDTKYLQMYVAEITADLPSWDVVPSNEVRALCYQ